MAADTAMSPLHPVTDFAIRLALRWRRPLLVAILALLYMVLVLGVASPLAKTLFVAHLGLFILWQPFVRADQRVALPLLAALLAVIGAAAVGLNGWILTLWIALLGGVVGGKVFLFEVPWTKLFFLLALFWLVAALLLMALPAAMPRGLDTGPAVWAIGELGSPVVFLLMLVLPEKREADSQIEAVDFVYSVIVVLLLAVLVLGSLALMLLLGHDYIQALLETLLVMGVALLALGWIWNPHAGMAGMGTVFSRYLLSVGLPVEQWLHTLADLAKRQQEPNEFVAEACRDMVRRLPWVTGVHWQVAGDAGSYGDAEGRASEFAFEALTLRIHTRYPLSPSLAWHFNLLAQLIAEFRADKLRAGQLKRLTYVEAIHETGARLTHDIKNLLQSLRGLCTAAQAEPDDISPAFVALLRRQLPAITARLEQTLDKLQTPRLESDERMPLGRWWAELPARYAMSRIIFVTDGDVATITIPAGLFDHVVENLLANALDKRAAAPDLRIEVTLRTTGGVVGLDVCDDGAAIPPALAADLFHGPVPSETGLGIGLFQTGRLLERSGYAISLASNTPGRVCFRLAPAGG
jgi:signal transduction histidine kinase